MKKIVERLRYVEQLDDARWNGLVKVITGIRRCGKSYLLFNLFYDYLLSEGVAGDSIIKLQLDLRSNHKLRDPDALLAYIKDATPKSQQYYIFLDEIQLVDDFVSVLNELLSLGNLDVYVTGSNSKFLSKDIITEFRGRGDEIHLLPLSFEEFYSASELSANEAWNEYIFTGGLPHLINVKEESAKRSYLENLFKETYLKDIIEKNNLRRTQELDDLVDVLASSVGSLVTARKISGTFKSVLSSKISLNTVKTYIDYLEDSFLIEEAKRFDIKGRKYIGSPVKYYFEDVGLRNAKLNFRQMEESHLMENVIFNELRYRGFSVDVGNVLTRRMQNGKSESGVLEVDFVANKFDRKLYIQSALSIPDDLKMEQECASLKGINDCFEKAIIVKDVRPSHFNKDGIKIVNLFDFLLEDE